MNRFGLQVTVLLAVAGCATAPPLTPEPVMVIDFASGIVTTPSWQAAFNDCSNSAATCIEAPDRFVMAFPRLCPTTTGPWEAAGFRFRMTAPTPHYGAPSGGYISDKYPHIHLGWREGVGFHTWSRTLKTPYEQGWDPNEEAEVYRIVYVGRPSPFACTSGQ
ncbi:hypothetical protein [Brevundimonas sp.]|uniref:hypothetical protein n=1 Tax=Brevundimonas sp. TaxID=1871086 RepID=UPI00391AB2EB